MSHFNYSDLLISRTDERGVITMANDDFCKIAEYSREELIGAPHKVVRHADMPRAVFYLMWDALKKGKPISAVVKNRTASEGYYWVLANVMPVNGGYMSVRTKPSEELIRSTQDLYATVRVAELEQKMSPVESLAVMEKGLQSMGFHNYLDFMSREGAQQWLTRNKACNRPKVPEVDILLQTLIEWDEIRQRCDEVLKGYDAFETLPFNMRIQAAREGTNGRALDVIASSFTELARSIRESLNNFSEKVDEMSVAIRSGAYSCCVDQLVSEAITLLKEEAQSGKASVVDLETLENDHSNLSFASENQTKRIQEESSAFLSELQQTQRNLTGLAVTRIMSEIENAQIESGGVAAITDKLSEFQKFSEESLRQAYAGVVKIRNHGDDTGQAA